MSFFKFFPFFVFTSFFVLTRSADKSICDQPYDVGFKNCSEKCTIKFYYNSKYKICMAFRYSGCGGNENRFNGLFACRKACSSNNVFCPGNTDEVLNKDGTTNCGGPEKKQCDGENSYCLPTIKSGLCCNKDARDREKNDYSQLCAGNRAKYVFGKNEQFLFGESCNLNFCPKNTECQQGGLYAYCCHSNKKE